MKRRLFAVVIAGALLVPAASSTRAIGNPNDFVRLPFTGAQCQVLIDRGAPFQIGDPEDRQACFLILEVGGPPR